MSLTIFATYWNEKDWIDASLDQIEALKPRQIIAIDGCYDPKYLNKSTDGTREKIEEWVARRENAELKSALRLSRLKALWYLFSKGITWWNWPLRILMMTYYSRTNIYRLNQAATFTMMLRDSGVRAGDWVMHIDSDQFYPDEVIENILLEVNDSQSEVELLTAKEFTFFNDFHNFTTDYESRDYNNMPYRVNKNTMIVPTRDVVTEEFPRPVTYGKDANKIRKSVGTYHHYKFRPNDPLRTHATYSVGDRKAPNTTTFKNKKYYGTYPSVILQNFSSIIESGPNP